MFQYKHIVNRSPSPNWRTRIVWCSTFSSRWTRPRPRASTSSGWRTTSTWRTQGWLKKNSRQKLTNSSKQLVSQAFCLSVRPLPTFVQQANYLLIIRELFQLVLSYQKFVDVHGVMGSVNKRCKVVQKLGEKEVSIFCRVF